jgi:hypothetical protein
MAMPFLTKSVDLTVGRIESGKKSGGAIAFVVVRPGLAASALEWQARLRAIQSLDLTFLVYAQHQRMLVTQNPKIDTEDIRGKLGQKSGTGKEDDAQESTHGRADRSGQAEAGARVDDMCRKFRFQRAEAVGADGATAIGVG